ncbi:MAG: hypothetical protein ACQEXJ_07100 [Myxococcota bacterium]
MNRTLSVLAVLLLATVTAQACGPGYRTKREKLQDTARQFNDDLRWKRLRSAAQAVPVERRTSWLARMERSSRAFTIVDYELTPVEIRDEVAVLQVDVSYHRAGGVHMKRTRRQQVWRYHSEGWKLDADKEVPREDRPPPEGLPDFGAEGDVSRRP